MPEWAIRNMLEFKKLNPAHSVELHGIDVILPEYKDVHRRIVEADAEFLGKSSVNANISDLARYSILERFGGWYFDVDMFPFRPIDEIERAWCLDGDKLFLSRQGLAGTSYNVGGATFRGDVAAAVLGLGDSARAKKAIKRLRDIVCSIDCSHFGAYGPISCSEFVARNPNLVEVSDKEWFFGIGPKDASMLYRAAIHGNKSPARHHSTGGQLPYAMHLWAQGWSDKITLDPLPSGCVSLCGPAINTTGVGKIVGDKIERTLKSGGYTVNRDTHRVTGIPSAVVVWNHKEKHAKEAVDYARKIGASVVIMELGFWDRVNNIQVDSCGFSHTSSWAHDVTRPPPIFSGGVPIVKKTTRRSGYILVLGQVTGDKQLDESEIKGMPRLEMVVKRAVPNGVRCFFRPHPYDESTYHSKAERLDKLSTDTPDQYVKTMGGGSLKEALSGASFVITINSTAIVESMVAGVPVLAFGPHIAGYAGAVKKTSISTLKKDIRDMLDGWTPDQDSVYRCIQWMASKHVSVSKFDDLDFVLSMLRGDN